MASYKRGTPVLFFVASTSNRGPVNKKVIRNLESFLIRVAKAKNPALLNKVGTADAGWSIKGVIRSAKGKPNGAANDFSVMMGFE